MARRFADCAPLLSYTSWAACYTVYSPAAGATRRQHRCKTSLLLSYHCRTTNTHIRRCLRPYDVLRDAWLKSRGTNATQRGFRCDFRGIGGGRGVASDPRTVRVALECRSSSPTKRHHCVARPLAPILVGAGKDCSYGGEDEDVLGARASGRT